MRDRLIELLNASFEEQYAKRMLLTAPHTADALLAAGVIVPPCKVGDTVYYPAYRINKVISYEVISIKLRGARPFLIACDGRKFERADFGKIVFLTREEAEKAIAERRGVVDNENV